MKSDSGFLYFIFPVMLNISDAPISVDVQVRYAETDAMGYVYYGNYFTYFEVARIAALAQMGHPYHEMEKKNILIPVLSASAEYKVPAHFGDILQIKVRGFRQGHARIKFTYEVTRSGRLTASGETRHTFINRSGKPIRPPPEIMEIFKTEPAD